MQVIVSQLTDNDRVPAMKIQHHVLDSLLIEVCLSELQSPVHNAYSFDIDDFQIVQKPSALIYSVR